MFGVGGTRRPTRPVGLSEAEGLTFTGSQAKADEALTIGPVNRVVPAAGVQAEAHAWAAWLARGPAIALRAVKEAIDTGSETGLAVERPWGFSGWHLVRRVPDGSARGVREGRPDLRFREVGRPRGSNRRPSACSFRRSAVRP
ncbi:enoyl-CoA hydratase-related protein [Streptomyces sp. NPDC056637]|uniref:enoyl-CoA hydratase-related protein n=1 Tax=unclassified Streptomyces TaxID=2593676 RepID=UPI00363CA1AE